MSDDSIDDAKNALQARKDIYLKLFENDKLREELFKKIFTFFSEKNKNEDYMYDLKQESIFNDFKNSIINNHFQWMSDRTINQNQTFWNSKYSINSSEVIKRITKKPYCDFYKTFKQFHNDLNLRPRAEKIIQKQLEELLNHIKCS